VVAGHQHVHPHVELLIINQQWPIYVNRNDCFLAVLQLLVALDYADAFATAGGGWLENEVFGFTRCLFAHLLVLSVLFGQDPRVGRDVELARVFQLHAKHVFPKHVLPPQIYGVREVVDLLVLIQSQYILDGRIPCPY